MQKVLKSPAEIKKAYPLSLAAKILLKQTKDTLQSICHDFSKKKILLIGPCSIHNIDSARIYAKKLASLQEKVSDQILILMRVHLEKPRTRNSWRGFCNDPDLDGSYAIQKGIELSRNLLVSILDLGVPISTEILDPLLFPFFDDCLSLGIIGARTVTSPQHRIIASDFHFPAGFKNRVDGDFESAIEAMKIAKEPHVYLGTNDLGQVCVKNSAGNHQLFLVLRGGEKEPNYQKNHIFEAEKILKSKSLPINIIIDCAHGNKKHSPQELVFEEIIEQHFQYNTSIKGLILESHLSNGKYHEENLKDAPSDISITDECLSFEKTEELVLNFYSKLIKSNQSLCL